VAGFLVWMRRFGGVGVVAALWIALSGVVAGQMGAGSHAAQAANELLVFDVASIREDRTSKPGDITTHVYSHSESGEFTAINLSLKELLQFAYGLPDKQILDVPVWAEQVRFDVQAKADPAVDEQIHKLDSDQAKLVKQQMVRALLEERFSLAAHQETRELPVYALIVAKGGAKVKESQNGGTNIDFGRTHISDRGCTMTVFADQLARVVGRVVVDKAGMAGRFDFALQWTPEDSTAAQSDASAPSIFTAVEEQLGLKLESAKAPVPVVVVDHVEMPSAN
jgi:uncharacterized protein (TIGR03435 family)